MSSFGVVFDMDGVIVDTNPYHKISLKQFCEKYGYQFSDEELIKRIYGRTNNEWIANLFGKLSKERLLELGEEKEAMFRAIYKDAIEPVAGLEGFLKKLAHQKIPTAIGTSAPRSNVDFILDNTGLAKLFPGNPRSIARRTRKAQPGNLFEDSTSAKPTTGTNYCV
jgi:beta-phosphoglucomutase